MNNTYTAHFIISLVLAIVLSACSTPSIRHKTPSISGIILIDGQPAAGIPVFISINGSDQGCYRPAHRTVSGLDGKFHLPSVKEHLPYTPVMTYYLDEWIICADIKGQRQTIMTGNNYGQGSVPSPANITCESQSASQLTCKPMFVTND